MSGTRYDLAVVAGTFTIGREEKKRWVTVGTLWLNDDGTIGSILIERTFNPAGAPVDPHFPESGKVYISVFEKEERSAPPRESRRSKRRQDDDDDIPF